MTSVTPRRRERRRPLWPAALLAGLVLTGLGLLHLGDRAGTPPAPPEGLPPAGLPLLRDASVHTTPRHERPPAPAHVAPPVRVRIPRLGVDAPVDPVALDANQALVVPPDPMRAGWYVHSPRPGEVGPAIIDGHVDTVDGPGVFFQIGALRPGDVIRVVRRDGTHAEFDVQAVERAPKDSFPTRRVYAPTSVPALRLITCGGAFDATTGHYEDNTIVYAVKRPSP